MKPGSQQPFSSAATRSRRGQSGFTLLELTIAMVFVGLLAGGIALSLSTCLKVWRRSQEAADLNQEARAIVSLLSRDIRSAYLGLNRDAGYFIGIPAEAEDTPIDEVYLTTESTSAGRTAFLPDEMRLGWEDGSHSPVTDYVAVSYQWLNDSGDLPPGLYRTTKVAPSPQQLLGDEVWETAETTQLVTNHLVFLEAWYYDGTEWLAEWDTQAGRPALPRAVDIVFALRDRRDNEHEFTTTIPVAVH